MKKERPKEKLITHHPNLHPPQLAERLQIAFQRGEDRNMGRQSRRGSEERAGLERGALATARLFDSYAGRGREGAGEIEREVGPRK